MKTAFSFVLEYYPEITGVVTADSDGQHNKMSIDSVKVELRENPESLILGVRCFDNDGIPWKSIFGNRLTVKTFQYISGIKVSDTQTGLRGIPKEYIRQLLNVKGERFEFETEMLIESLGKYPIIEVSISTIYDSEKNHKTHFQPILDSLKIYRVFGRIFLKYILSSFSSSFLDLVLFSIFCYFLNDSNGIFYVFFSTILARMISAVYNYLVNSKIVFCSKENVKKSFVKYSLLVILQMSLSACCVTLGVYVFSMVEEIVIKIIVDTMLFFISYHIQRVYIFH